MSITVEDVLRPLTYVEWTHYRRGGVYRIVSIGLRSCDGPEDGTPQVCYRAVARTDGGYWVEEGPTFTTPLARWLQTMDYNGGKVQRFRPYEESA